MACEGPAERIALTVNTQPLMLTAGVAAYRAWLAAGGAEPAIVAGHSLGEYAALVAAGAISFADAVPLVRFRAQAMQDAVPAGQGAMAALLGLDADTARAVCAAAAGDEVVEAANLNAPGQIVIGQGAKRAMMLPVSAPFHCALMKPAAERLAERLAGIAIATPKFPILNNVDVNVCDSAAQIRDALVRQAYSPVRWIETIQAIAARGITHILECGPGKVLTGMNKRIAKDLQVGSLHDADSLNQSIAVVR